MPRITRTIVLGISLAAIALGLGQSATAQQRPSGDLTQLPPVPTDYTPQKTAWGDYDFTGTWPYEFPAAAQILFQRPKGYGDRIWITDEEHAKRVVNAGKSDEAYSPENAGLQTQAGTQGMSDWIQKSDFSWRTSLLVSPQNGQLPPLTPEGDALFKAGRSGWVPGQNFDFVDDFDTWDRCITRGIPASMFPNRYNNALRLFQSPGYIVIQVEILATRVIPIVDKKKAKDHWPHPMESWMGNSIAYWEGKTLVIDTTNIKSGDAVSHDLSKRSAAPVMVTMIGGAPRNTIPTSDKAHMIEKLTMTGPDSILYEVTYDDPKTFTAPWTAQLEWSRNDDYFMPEYACHEGDVQLRNYINANRATRAAIAKGELDPKDYDDGNRNFDRQFDRDPVAPLAPGEVPFGAPPPAPPKDAE